MTQPQTEQTPRERILATAAALKLTMETEFVPFSKSRNAKPQDDGKVWRSLNWRVTIKRDGRDVLTTDYSAGEAHCPAYKQDRAQAMRLYGKGGIEQRIAYEIEHGTEALHPFVGVGKKGKPILPEFEAVLASLTTDSDVIDYATYEEWACEFGYDPDSRKGEATYRACLEIALKLRAGIGEDGLRQLREACQDY